MPFLGKPPVRASADFSRVQALPQRPPYPPDFVDALSKVLRADAPPGECPVCKNGDPCRLLENQAKALWDLGTYFRGYFPMRVGAGKCHGRGTPILMFDGSIKPVEDVHAGDQIMGPDSTPRTVRSTCTGREEMYRVVPIKGDSYVVNRSHILCLKKTRLKKNALNPSSRGGQIRDLSVEEYIAESGHFKRNWKGWRTGVSFAAAPVREAYILGVWLGDGSATETAITTMDPEIESEVRAWAAREGLDIRAVQQAGNRAQTYHLTAGRRGGPKRNPALEWLRGIGVLGNKHVPQAYKANDREVRLQVLAGLMDTDGHLSRCGFDYISKSERLADDVCFLARSLGFAAYKKEALKGCQTGAVGIYYRVSISGNVSEIPCRLPRKQAPRRQQKKDVLVTGIRLEPLGVGDYYGFELDGDGRYLLGDFTVTHNTLVSFLAPRVVGAKRPLLIVPAALMQKTEREWHEYSRHWKIAKHLKFRSYEKLSRVSGADLLDLEKPDLILADECYKLKSLRTAWTRRIARYIKANPTTMFVPLGGSVMKSSIKDFTHLMHWSHKDQAPVPHYAEAIMEWSEALDEGVNGMLRREPGVLNFLCQGFNNFNVEDRATLDENQIARRVFFERCSRTPGIVVADTKDEYTGSLAVSALEYTPNAKTEENFKTLRTTMCRPDGWALSEAVQAWAVARMLAIGLHYDWQPRPPQEWLDARKMWATFVRETLAKPSANRMGLDTELQVANAVIDGRLEDEYGLLEAWRAIKPTFTVNSVPVWHDETALRVCCDWMADHPAGICWVEHRHFAETLSKMSGIPYFGAKGLDSRGNFIQDASGPVIASIAANSAGRNLQDKWCDNLVTAAPADSERWEQLIGRTHRRGQRADAVTVDVLVGCREHLEAVPRAVSSAAIKKQLLGFSQKLQIADLTWPSASGRKGFRWE